MANHVWSRVVVTSDEKELHQQLEDWFTNLGPTDVRGTVQPLFGDYETYPIDEIGSKWIYVEDFDNWSENETYINFCSAWHFPEGYMEQLAAVVLAMDSSASLEVRGDEESDDFLVGGYGDINGFSCYMDDSPDRPWEEQFDDYNDYDEHINEFYDEVNDVQDDLIERARDEISNKQGEE